jgi:hypothetical protein
VVRPNEIPKVVGLRHDNGPDADPPATAHIPACARPIMIKRSTDEVGQALVPARIIPEAPQ